MCFCQFQKQLNLLLENYIKNYDESAGFVTWFSEIFSTHPHLAKRLKNILNNGCPNASFIPEIWQGHKNNGEGFWTALKKLEKVI